MFLILAVLTVSLNIATSQQPSTCPNILTYESRNLEDDRWYAVLTLESDEDLTGVYINVLLDRPAQLLGNWFGELTTTDNTEFLIQDRQYKIRARKPFTIRFFVKFNRAQIVPSVSVVRFNGKTVCGRKLNNSIEEQINRVETSGIVNRPTSSTSTPYTTEGRQTAATQSANRRETTNRPFMSDNRRPSPAQSNNREEITKRPFTAEIPRTTTSRFNLETVSTGSNFASGESYYKEPGTSQFNSEDTGSSDINKLATPDDDSDYFHGDFAQTVGSSQNKPESSVSSQVSESNQACGIVTTRPSPLIANGQDTRPGQWPWHASLYHSKGLQLQYICGGTLITNQHVLTAAHCVTKTSTERAVNKRNLLVYLGKHTLISFGPEVQDRDVESIIIHPEYNASSYFNDIALLKLTRPVQITNHVRMCCLWEEDPDLATVENKIGTVVGWGFDENKKLSNKLMQAQMPIVPTIKCIYSNREFFVRYTFDKNFCAGFKNGTSVCNGDSGGGLVFPKRGTRGQNTVWQIRGLVSIGVALQGHGVCDTSQFIVFSDVAKHLHWLRQVISY